MQNLLKNRTNIILIVILLLAAILRLYRISDYLTFLGDEGRDVLVVKHILEGHFTLLGPRASAGDFYTGPIYYYMMAPFLWLFHYDPVGPAVMIALLGIATVWLHYKIGKEFFGTKAGLIAAALYSVSPLVISYSRSSWNPNPMPFFTLLLLYVLYKAMQHPSWKKFLTVGILYGIALQLHYIEVFVGIIIFFFVLFGSFVRRIDHETVIKTNPVLRIITNYIEIFFGFLVGYSLFLFFEIRHGFPNTKTIIHFIMYGDPKATDLVHTAFLSKVGDVFFRLFARLLLRFPPPDQTSLYKPVVIQMWEVATMIVAISAIFFLFKNKNKLAVLLLSLWLFFGVVLFGFYNKPIYDYYFEFMFPLPFLLVGNLFGELVSIKKWSATVKILCVTAIIFLVGFNLYANPFRFEPNRQKDQVKTIAEFVLSKTNNEPFNFALLTLGNSDHAYRYYFEIENHSPVMIENSALDPKRQSVTNQLMVVCEDTNCEPLGASLWEVAGFGRANIVGEWNVSVVKVYKLVHYVGK